MHKLGEYEIYEKLGQGSFGTVYRAIDTTNKREVALKILHPESAQDRDLIGGALREANNVRKLGRVPNVVEIYEAGSIDQRVFIASQLIKGKPLTDAIKDQRFNSVATILRVLDDLAKALDSVHAAGVVHQDVKPANILIDDETGQLYLCDFGLAHAARDSRGSFSAQIRNSPGGTLNYMAPEIPSSFTPKPAQDIFSLGVVAYELFTGRRPFPDSTYLSFANDRKAAVPKPGALSSLVTPPIEAVLLKAISLEPGKRYSTAGKFLEALRVAADRPYRKPVDWVKLVRIVAVLVPIVVCLGVILGIGVAIEPVFTLISRGSSAAPRSATAVAGVPTPSGTPATPSAASVIPPTGIPKATSTLLPKAAAAGFVPFPVCPSPVDRLVVETWAAAGSVSISEAKRYIDDFDGVRKGGEFVAGVRLPAGVAFVTDFGNGESERYATNAIRPIAHYRSYGIFETVGPYTTISTGSCMSIKDSPSPVPSTVSAATRVTAPTANFNARPDPIHLINGAKRVLPDGWTWVCTGDFTTEIGGKKSAWYDVGGVNTGLVLVVQPDSGLTLDGAFDVPTGVVVGDCRAYAQDEKEGAIASALRTQFNAGCGSQCQSVNVIELDRVGKVVTDRWEPSKR